MAEADFDFTSKIPEKFSERKLQFSPINEVNRDESGKLNLVEGLNGPLVFLSSKGIGYSAHNEDSQYLNTWANTFISVDGMGGMGEKGSGRRASLIISETFKNGLEFGAELKSIYLQAKRQLVQNNLKDGGACFLAGKIKGNILETYQAGDVRAIVIKKNDQIEETIDECHSTDKSKVKNYLTGDPSNEREKLTVYRFFLHPGDRIVIASDGVWDNFYSSKDSPQEESTRGLARLIKDKPLKEASQLLDHYLKSRMASGQGKKDNYNFIIYDFVKPAGENLSLSNARNIREVLMSFDKIKGIQGQKEFYSTDQLKNIVKDFLNGRLTARHLTRNLGLREKIMQLALR